MIVKVLSVGTGAGIYNCSILVIDKDLLGSANGDKFIDLVAPAWVLGTVYAVGEYVLGTDSKPYRCKTAHTATNDDKPITGDNYADDWELVDSIEVLNLLENYTVASPSPALGLYDRMEVCQLTDNGDPSTTRWVGRPIHRSIRSAKVKSNAGANQYISCDLIGYNGVAITAGLGSSLTVYVKANKEGTPTGWTVDGVGPRLAQNDIVQIVNIAGTWYFVNIVSKSENQVV